MSNAHQLESHDPDQPMVYQIRIKGHLGREWADWFEGLTLTSPVARSGRVVWLAQKSA